MNPSRFFGGGIDDLRKLGVARDDLLGSKLTVPSCMLALEVTFTNSIWLPPIFGGRLARGGSALCSNAGGDSAVAGGVRDLSQESSMATNLVSEIVEVLSPTIVSRIASALRLNHGNPINPC
jgi:hypothetical protein